MTNGSTTENHANSIEEQKSVIKTVVETVDGAVPVVAGVSQPGTKKTIELANRQEVGADCVMVSLLTITLRLKKAYTSISKR